MGKTLKRVCLTMMAALLVVMSFVKVDRVDAATVTQIGINNMINIIIEDQTGNQITNGQVKIKDASGNLYASYDLSTNTLTKGNDSTLYKMGSSYNIDKSYFQKYISGGKLASLYYNYGHHDNVTISSSQKKITLCSMPDTSTHTLPANTIGLYVDPAWASTPDCDIVIGGTKVMLNTTTGYTTYSLPAGSYKDRLNVDWISTNYAEVKSSTANTEYVKQRIKLSDLNNRTFTSNGLVITSKGHAQIASGNLERCAGLVFVSGGMITVSVPDDQGYVEVYVEKSNVKTWYNQCATYDAVGSSGGTSFYAYTEKDMTIQGVPAPAKGFGLLGVETGKYTLELELDNNYAVFKPQPFDVKSSDSIQEFKFTVHMHDFNGTWKTDSNKHWTECCGIKKNETTHTYGSWVIDKAATEKSTGLKHRNCTICNYKQTETIAKLAHTHKYSDEFSKDATNHWYECPCGSKKSLAAHSSTKEATEDTPKTCDTCGYIMVPALGHVNHTADTSKYYYDENTHWYQCIGCTLKMSEKTHNFEWIIDYEATEDIIGQKHEECTDCHYQKEAVEIPPVITETTTPATEETTTPATEETTEPSSEETTTPNIEETTELETEQTTTESGTDSSNNNGFNWIWLIIGITSIVVLIIIIIIILAKKKKENDKEN